MKLELLMSYHANLKPAQPVGKGPYGNRQIAEVTGLKPFCRTVSEKLVILRCCILRAETNVPRPCSR